MNKVSRILKPSWVRSSAKLNSFGNNPLEYYNQNLCLSLRLDRKKSIVLFRILFYLRQQNEPCDVYLYVMLIPWLEPFSILSLGDYSKKMCVLRQGRDWSQREKLAQYRCPFCIFFFLPFHFFSFRVKRW